MSETQESKRKEILEKLISFIKSQKNLAAEKITQLVNLAPQYYKTIPIEDFTARSVEELCRIMMNHFELMEQRQPKECKIRVFNPTIATHAWHSTHTIIEVSYDDMPFLVDSTRVELNRQGITTHLMITSGGIKVRRNQQGKLLEILPADSSEQGSNIEAIIHMEIDRQTDPKILENIRNNLLQILEDVNLVVEDWQKMRQQLFKSLDEFDQLNQLKIPILNREEIEESKEFLQWLVNNHFTFLGYREYEVVNHENKLALRLIHGTGLGVLRDESTSKVIRYFDDLPEKVRDMVLSPHILIISKTNTRATVHRSTYTDYIGVKRFDEKGNLIGERRFIGLFTSEAYNSNPLHIPFLRLKVAKVLEKSKLPRTGHAARALNNIIATLPRDDVFQASTDELYELAMGVLNLQERRRIRLFVRKDAYERYFSCLVYVPRENFSTELLYRMREILKEAFHGIEMTLNTYFSDSVLARIHFVVRVDPKQQITYDIKAIEDKLIKVGRSWYDDFRDELTNQFGEEKSNELYSRYFRAFPAGYREAFLPKTAVSDIRYIETLHCPEDLGMSFHRPDEKSACLHFKLFHLKSTIPLSDALPIFENMGMRVIGEEPHQITFRDGTSVWINDFHMEYASDTQLNVEVNKEIFQNAFYKIWRGEIENDGFNRLVLKAQLNWHEITMFRAYAKYLRQTGFTFSQQYIEETLVANPGVAALLVKLFKLRFEPSQQTDRTAAMLALEEDIKKALDMVANLDQDRILRRFCDIIKATVRTNFFQTDEKGQIKSYLSFKFDSKLIPELPLPLPMYEIFVYSSRFEGIHLRAGKVARGGIRWSDRREDFRTEILGLMKAQQVKNALIVPAGAKGGFVTKALPPDGNREAIMEETIACYKNFIRGLLDLTDNIVNNKIVHPEKAVLYDENDPYLVVAADKGTATFSDIANSISSEYRFWLDDAFASGGSTGYDHKKMGITARGAWESVKHHFQQLAMDFINEPFTAVGIGDMSGDVFGNGMLLSDKIRLVAAFNHMHIFLDPTPNPKISFEERKRLFNLPRSSWEDYNRELISRGGGVYKRSQKSIQLSSEIRTALDFDKEFVEPNELIRAILKAPVDLIWNGGIGTYVKNKNESNLDAGDRANDAIRINGNDLRSKVVGEGGNLGFTQLGRIEYEMNGGKINTDFIDNSAGVDCSDHEVNIKILLNECVRSKKMTEDERNKLLAEMTEEVAKLVLHDNYRQVRTITRSVSQSLESLSLYMRYISDQERDGKINRQLEFLPDNQTLLERKGIGKGLTRPETAVLLAYSKILLKEEILKSDLVEDPYLAKYMETAFPKRLVEKFSQQMYQHRLRREIIATQLSNALVNEMGITFIYQMQDETGASAAFIVQAYAIMRQIFEMPKLLIAIDSLDESLPASLALETMELEMMLEVMRLVRRAVRWLLRNMRPPYRVEETIQNFSGKVAALYQKLPDLLLGTEKENYEMKNQTLVNAKVPMEIANKIAGARYIYSALNIIQVATENNVDVDEVATIYFIMADRLELVWFREKINAYPVDNHWSALARSTFKDELDAQQRALVNSVLKHKKDSDVLKNINIWFKDHQTLLQRWQAVVTQLRGSAVIDPSMLTVAIRELSQLAEISSHGIHSFS